MEHPTQVYFYTLHKFIITLDLVEGIFTLNLNLFYIKL